MKYKIADFIVEINNQYKYIDKQCADFLYDANAKADIVVDITNDDICFESLMSEEKYPVGYLESVCAYRKLCLSLPMKNALLLHASVISCNGRGIAFLAKSGVGKTTHTRLWKKVYGDKVKIINGDKPIIRFFDNVPFAYGTPWAGKENFYLNEKTELTDICFLERGMENSASKVNTMECFNSFMNQILRPDDTEALMKTLELIEKLLLKCNLWSIKCNMEDEAAIAVYNKIFEGENNDIKI